MKIYLRIIIFFFILQSYNFAQNIYICESYSEEGNPIGIINKLETKSYGKPVNILIDNEKNFNSHVLYLFIDKLNDGKYVPFDSKIINLDKDKFWAVANYVFVEAGTYEIYFLNSSEKKIASLKLEVISEIESILAKDLGSSQFVFCDMIVNDRPMNPISQLSISERGGEVYAFINNYSPFNSDRIIVKIWKRKEGSSEYQELISTKKFKVTSHWSVTFFKLNFTDTGDYKIDVNDKNNKLLISKVLTVIN